MFLMLLACGREEAGSVELARRPAADRAAETLEPCEGAPTRDNFRPLCTGYEDVGEVGLLPIPGLPPLRTGRMVEPPKLIRRTKGVLGTVLEFPKSSSSIAFSSIESELFELVERLPRRMLKGWALEGEVPERPSVVTERRRRLPSIETWPGKPEPLGTELPLWKRLVRAAWEMEPRRFARAYISGLLELVLSVDIVKEKPTAADSVGSYTWE